MYIIAALRKWRLLHLIRLLHTITDWLVAYDGSPSSTNAFGWVADHAAAGETVKVVQVSKTGAKGAAITEVVNFLHLKEQLEKLGVSLLVGMIAGGFM